MYGWKVTQMDLAATGLFNLSNKTPLESVWRANLYEALTVLSIQRERDLIEIERMKKQQHDHNPTA